MMIRLFQITAAIMFHKIFLSEQPEKKKTTGWQSLWYKK